MFGFFTTTFKLSLSCDPWRQERVLEYGTNRSAHPGHGLSRTDRFHGPLGGRRDHSQRGIFSTKAPIGQHIPATASQKPFGRPALLRLLGIVLLRVKFKVAGNNRVRIQNQHYEKNRLITSLVVIMPGARLWQVVVFVDAQTSFVAIVFFRAKITMMSTM
ncbi:hypothetical protein J6590_019047 [Homalodisca vitripennis]|nr:hypothetical protein J6590_019047 [Homalodisca vitripennis]